MKQIVHRIWAQVNAVLLILVMIYLAIDSKHILISDGKINLVETIILLIIISIVSFLIVLFIRLFVRIQKINICRSTAIFYLLGSMFSLFLIMVVKVMADEIAREWTPGNGELIQHGEYWIMYTALGLILLFLITAGIKKEAA